jgi:parallel beta-helix repeat protein
MSFNGNTNKDIFPEQNDLSIPNEQILTNNPIIGLYSDAEMDAFFAGNGTLGTNWTDAYVLKDRVFDGESIRTCIEFDTTTRYVVIDNCTFLNAQNNQYGVLLDGVNNTLINNSKFIGCDWGIYAKMGDYDPALNISVIDCDFSNNEYGVHFKSVDDSNITRNYFTGNNISIQIENGIGDLVANNEIIFNTWGIKSYIGENNEILNNNISNIAEDGIYMMSASEFYPQSLLVANNRLEDIGDNGIEVEMWECTIENNTLNNIGSDGIRVSKSDNNILNNTITGGNSNGIYAVGTDLQIKNNTITNFEEYGIYLVTGYSTVDCQYNRLYSCGFYVSPLSGFTLDETNKVNGKPVLFEYDNATVDISSTDMYGQILLFKCPDAIIDSVSTYGMILDECNSISLTNCIISTAGIILRYCDSSSLINCNVSTSGIILRYCDSSSITNCDISGSNQDGIEIMNCPNIVIDSCDVSTTGRNGISLYSSNYSIIKNNVFNDMAIAVRIGYSDFSNISNCQIQNYDEIGLKTEFSDNITVENCEIINGGLTGIDITESESVVIENTLIDSTEGSGIFAMWDSIFLEIKGCIIRNNPDYGINLRLSDFKIIDNLLEDNIESGIFIDNDFIGVEHNFYIANNTIRRSARGIDLMYVCELGGNAELLSNLIENCQYGIHTQFSHYITSDLNTISDCGSGIRFSGAESSNIRHNSISQCDWGIEALDTQNVEITHNLINTTDIGISYSEISGEIRYNTIYYYSECISGYTSYTLDESENICTKIIRPTDPDDDGGDDDPFISGFTPISLLIFGSLGAISVFLLIKSRRKK